MRINGTSIKNTAVNLCLLLVSGVVGLSLCETTLRLFYPKYEHLAQARFRDDAVLIWTRKPNSRHSRRHPDVGFSHTVLFNNLALRQSRNFSADDLLAATNIGVFGDSFVENIFMAAPHSFTEPLDYLLNQSEKPFNVLNFGIHGYGPGQSYLRYEHFRNELAQVLFVYCRNDLRNLYETNLFHLNETGGLERNELIRSPWWVRFISRLHLSYLILDVSGRLSSHVQENSINQRLRDEHQSRISEQGNLHTEHVDHNLYRGTLSDEDLRNMRALFQKVLRRWKQLVENNGGRFSVVLLPNLPPEPHVVDLLEKEDIEVVDLYDCFGNHDPAHKERAWANSPYRFRNDGHWNEAGNQLAAICLYRFLAGKVGLPSLSEDRLWQAISRYYAAFEDEIPLKTGREGEGAISLETAVAIREKYLALDMSNPLKDLKEEIVELVVQPDKRIIISDFDVYLDGNRLIYVKEECRPDDTRAQFFLHVIPVDESDLPEYRRQYGFENRDFNQRGVEIGDHRCAIRRQLPAYPIRHIRTGQYTGKGRLWEGEFAMEQDALEQVEESPP